MDQTLSRSAAGQVLDGRYRVESFLARGGMATVYLGTDTKLDRPVALKIAHPELTGDEQFVRRFTSEARSVARLSSPNVVAVHDQGRHGQLLYLVMEYVPGRTLRDLLRERGRLGPREALDITEGVLAGLAAAHQAGLVHRDVKPENVLLTPRNEVKVADFGLARAAAVTSHTKTGVIIGTAAYLAPEQVSHSVADARSDVYAAGVMLFELLTGVQPHRGESPLAVAHKHVIDVVPAPSSLVPGLPPSLDSLVARATSRDPARRPADAAQFLQALTEVRRGLPIAAPGPSLGPPGPSLGPPGAQPTRQPTGFPWFRGEPGQQAGPGRPADIPLPGPARPAGPGSPMPAVLPHGEPAGAAAPVSHTLIVPAAGLPYADGEPPYSGDRGHRRGGYRGRGEPWLQRLLFSRRVVYLALAVAAAVIIGVIGWWVTAGQYVTVPRVHGMAVGIARAELRNLGFKVRSAPGRHSNTVASGDVIATVPAIGSRAARGSTVRVIASTGPVMISMPQVTGMQLAQAEAALKKAGLKRGTVKQASSATVAAGVVIATRPPAGTSWPQRKPVVITESAGPPLPNLVGQQFTAAQGIAGADGFQVQQVTDKASTAPQGQITAQSPAPGTPITHGEVVIVHVSPGPPQVAIPNVVGKDPGQAKQILQQAGFQVTIQPGIGNKVASESPMGQAPKGTMIVLTLGIAFP